MKTLKVDLTKVSNELYDILPPGRPRGIALGYFDGVHRGHQELVRVMVQRSAELGLESDVFSFDRYPKPVPKYAMLNATSPGNSHHDAQPLRSPLPPAAYAFKGLLQTADQRDEQFAALGVDNIILQEFNSEFAGLSPEEFCDLILRDKLNTKVLVVGDDYRFAKAQAGNIEMLTQWAETHGVELHVVPSVKAEGKILSSSLIREYVEAGRMPEAGRLLGHSFSIPGKVIHGKALGRTIGMPTANIRIPYGMVIPSYGVYVSRTRVGQAHFDSVTNVGLRPTVNHTDPVPLVETCILDRELELYDQEIEVEFLELMRPELRFPSFIAMSNEIAKDLVKAREWHKAHEKAYLYTLAQDIPLYVARSKRFNTAYLQIDVYLPLEAEHASEYALLSQVLTAVSQDYPSRPELQSFLDTQYGAEISADISAVSNLQKITFHMSAVHSGLDGSSPFANSVGVFLDMLLKPARDDEDHFLPHIIETERQNLHMALLAEENDLSQYAYDRAKAHLYCDGTRLLNPLGDKERLSAVDKTSLRQAWMRMLAEGRIHALLLGNIGDTSIADRVAHELSGIPRSQTAMQLVAGRNPQVRTLAGDKSIVEIAEGELAHVVAVYDGMPLYTSLQSLSGHVLNLMLGASAQSLLFQEIREALGFAYYVDSIYDPFSRTVTIIAEVDSSEVEETNRAIEAQVARLAAGDYEEALFAGAKKLFQNDLSQKEDDAEDRLAFISEELLAGAKFNIDEALIYSDTIEQAQITAIAANLRRRLTYVLRPSADADDEKGERS